MNDQRESNRVYESKTRFFFPLCRGPQLNCSNLLVEIQGQDGTNQYTKDYNSFQFKRTEGAGISITSVLPRISPNKDSAETSKRRKVSCGNEVKRSF